MSARISRRTVLAGLAAMPALALVGCEFDRTTAGPISTVDTLDFSNRLRYRRWPNPPSARTGSASSTSAQPQDRRNSSLASRRRPGFIPTVGTTPVISAQRYEPRVVSRFG